MRHDHDWGEHSRRERERAQSYAAPARKEWLAKPKGADYDKGPRQGPGTKVPKRE